MLIISCRTCHHGHTYRHGHACSFVLILWVFCWFVKAGGGVVFIQPYVLRSFCNHETDLVERAYEFMLSVSVFETCKNHIIHVMQLSPAMMNLYG